MRELQQALESLAAERTIILVLEDLHWSDAATVAALAGFSLARQLAADERAEAMQHLRDLHAAVDDGIDVAELHAIRRFLA